MASASSSASVGPRRGERWAVALDRLVALELRRAVLWLPVGMGLGIWLYLDAAREPGPWALALPLGPALALAIPWIRARMATRALAAGLLAVALGHALAQFSAERARMPRIERALTATVEGRVVALDRASSGAPRILLAHAHVFGRPAARTPPRLRITLTATTRAEAPRPGDWVRVHATLLTPGDPVEPGGFDFARRAYFDRLGAIGFARSPAVRLPAGEVAGARGARAPPAGPLTMLDRWRHATADALVAALPGPRGAFAAAILVGDRAAIDEADAEALRISSLAHLLAISGLHMGLLTGLVFAGCRLGLAVAGPVAMHWPAKKVAAAVALAAGAGYLGASGATVPTQRAFTMVAVALVAVMLDRPAITLRALALAAAIVLAIRPVSLVDPGFQMSFAATTALVAVYEALRARGRAVAGPAPSGRGAATAGRAGAGPPEAMSGGGGRPWIGLAGRLGRGGLRWAGAVALTSLVAGSATAPFAAAHFNRVAPWGLIANLAAVPVMGMWIAPSAAVAAVLAPLGLAAPALWLMGEGIGVVLAIAHGVAGLPGADGGVVSPPAGVLGAVALGGLWLAIWRGWWRLAGLALVVPALMAWHGAPPRPDLLVSPGGRLVGVMTPSGRALDHARADGYAARRWLDADGDRVAQAAAAARAGFAPPVDPEAPRRPAEVAAPLGAAGAGWQVVVQRGRRDAEGRAARACLPRVVLVAPAVDGPVDGGCATIGRAVLRAGGAVAVRIEAGEARLKTSRPAGGRPWRP